MEATFEPSVSTILSTIRTKMAAIEAVELSVISLVLWGLMIFTSTNETHDFATLAILFLFVEGALLGSWAIYLAYIRVTRGMYPRLDIRLRFLIAVITGSYTFWAWIILDINRWILSKLVYQGEAPVEYAWSPRSKLVRKEWEQAQKAKQVYLSV